jgi:hypothetical protein
MTMLNTPNKKLNILLFINKFNYNKHMRSYNIISEVVMSEFNDKHDCYYIAENNIDIAT